MTRTQKRLIARLIELGWTGGTAQYRTDYDAMEFSEGLFGDCAYWEIMAWFGVESTTRAYKHWRFNNSTDAAVGAGSRLGARADRPGGARMTPPHPPSGGGRERREAWSDIGRRLTSDPWNHSRLRFWNRLTSKWRRGGECKSA